MKGRRVLVIDDVITAGMKVSFVIGKIEKYYEEKDHDRHIQI